MDFGIYLVRRGLISSDDYVDAREAQSNARRKLGELALSSRKLTMRQVMAILDAQVDSPQPFGELAIKMGYLTQSDVLELLGMQVDSCPSILEILSERPILDRVTLRKEAQRFRVETVKESLVDQHI
jgi:hypothetical protein